MRSGIVALIFVVMTANSSRADLTQVVSDGFGLPSNRAVFATQVFRGKIFAGTSSFQGLGELRSSVDGNTFSPVGLPGFGAANVSLLPDTVFDDRLYVMGGGGSGLDIWRSSDGVGFSQTNTSGFGDPGNVFGTSHVFRGQLYVGTFRIDANNGELWRSPDGTTWTEQNPDGFGTSTRVVPLGVFRGRFYVRADGVWRSSDGSHWEPVPAPPTAIDGVVFRGALYLGTDESEVWRTTDGTNFTRVDPGGFDDPANDRFTAYAMGVFDDQLWVGPSNGVSGGRLWRSPDGMHWARVGAPGLGSVDNEFVSIGTVFGGTLFLSPSQNAVMGTEGGEVWRLSNPLGPGSITMADAGASALVLVDPLTGNRSELTGSSVGAGPALDVPRSIDTAPNGTLLVTDSGTSPAVFEVEPFTGDREIVSSLSVGSGSLGSPLGIAVEDSGTILVSDQSLENLLRIAPDTGDRTILTSFPAGTVTQMRIDLDENGDVLDANILGELLRIDSATGDFEVLSSNSIGSGPSLATPTAVLARADGSIFMTDLGAASIFSIDPTTGDRSIVSGSGVGSGAAYGLLFGITEGADGTLLVADNAPGAILRVDPSTGDRIVLSSSTLGAGAPFQAVGGLIASPLAHEGDFLVLSEHSVANDWALDSVEADAGDRTVVSGPDIGSGPSLFAPRRLVREASGHALVSDGGSAGSGGDFIARVDLMTAARTVLSSDVVGSGPPLLDIFDMALEPTGDLLVLDLLLEEILRVDTTTGDRSTLASAAIGTGPALIQMGDIAVGPKGRIFVTVAADSILEVDPVTGDRSVLTSSSVGSGPLLNGTNSLAVDGLGRVITGGFLNDFLIRVTPNDGAREILTSPLVASGPVWSDPTDLAIASDGTILVLDTSNIGDAITIAVDPFTGDRSFATNSEDGIGKGSAIQRGQAIATAPVPEPASLISITLGVLCLAWIGTHLKCGGGVRR